MVLKGPVETLEAATDERGKGDQSLLMVSNEDGDR